MKHPLPPRHWPLPAQGLAWLALLAPVFYLSYGLANHLAAARADVPSLVFGWEAQIPFWAWSVVPYWSLNLLYAASVLLARSRHELQRHVARLLTAQVVAVLCFIAWPLRFSFAQPAADGLPGWLFEALRSFDQPFNQAPSLHIALALIVWDLLRRRLPAGPAQMLLAAWMGLIAVSVLTTRQHHFIDLPTGALLGLLVLWLWPLERRPALPTIWRLSACPRRRRLAAAYAAGTLLPAAAAVGIGGGALWLWWPAVSLLLVALIYLGLGARGFQPGRDGRMAAPLRVLLAPYRLGAWLNSRGWTWGLPALREVAPGVSIGSLTRLGGMARLTRPGRWAARHPQAPTPTLLSLCAELQPPAGLRCTVQPWLDLVPASAPALRRASALIDQAVQRGEPVVVACALGFSRSAAAVACWLVHSGHAASLDEAIARLRRRHPHIVLDAGWRQALQQAVQQGRA